MTSKRLIVISGPTASGKTQLSIELAEAVNGEVINADSVQIYRDFDIGSAKPSNEDRTRIPHHLIGVAHPEEDIDAMAFSRRADEVIDEIRARGSVPILVGGTGLWVRALLRGLVDLPAPDPELRRALEAQYDAWGSERSHARLAEVDPLCADAIHPNDRQRVVRALEVLEQTGRALGEWQQEHKKGRPRYLALVFALTASGPEHDERIEARLETMFERGWVEEVRGLREKYAPTARAFGSVGYRQLVAQLDGQFDLTEAKKRIRKATRIYARRQRTWLSSDPDVSHRLDRPDTSTALGLLNAWMNE